MADTVQHILHGSASLTCWAVDISAADLLSICATQTLMPSEVGESKAVTEPADGAVEAKAASKVAPHTSLHHTRRVGHPSTGRSRCCHNRLIRWTQLVAAEGML